MDTWVRDKGDGRKGKYQDDTATTLPIFTHWERDKFNGLHARNPKNATRERQQKDEER